MISQAFVTKTEHTEQQAQKFFEFHPCLVTPDKLIAQATLDGFADDNEIDWDLFKHLMNKYHYIGY